MTTTALDAVITFDQLPAEARTAEQKRLWRAFEQQLASMDDSEARAHLRAGRPITYRDEKLGGRLLREWPDGRREHIDVLDDGTIVSLGPV